MHTIAQLISMQAAARPDHSFLRYEDAVYSFGYLERQVRRNASALRSFGLKAGDRVGLMMSNHPPHVFLYLALSWLGASCMEFSIHMKRSGLELQLQDADPRFMLADAGFADQLEPAAHAAPSLERILWLGEGRLESRRSASLCKVLASSGETGIAPAADLDRVQAISYTSGTTGRPKGAMLTERWFQVGAKNAGLLAGVREDDVLFLWEPFYHVAGWMTVLMSLQHGIPIGMVERFSGSRCWSQIRQHRATLFHYLGGAMNILLKQPPRADDRDNQVRVAWGAAAPAQSWRAFEGRFGVVVREGYGITEGQNFTHINIDGPVGSIGLPVEEFESWIEGENANLSPPGEIGEIVLKPKAPGMTMAGYFGDPDRTADVLRNGCVYTGDLGYQDGDGYFYFSGRKKDSLRRRGENVSAWEVERVINAHPAVEESAVIGVASEIGEQDIKVFIKLADSGTLDPMELIEWCERDLAYYQIPRFVEFVPDFPRGPTQRIRKAELPDSAERSWDRERSDTGSRVNRKQPPGIGDGHGQRNRR